jgi:tyrosinase
MFSSDPEVGFGGWGDSSNDFQISTGAFAHLVRAYPVPHHIRRNFTIQPWRYIQSPFPDNQSFIDPQKTANTTFTPETAQYLTNNFAGDFLNWHFFMEGADVSGDQMFTVLCFI